MSFYLHLYLVCCCHCQGQGQTAANHSLCWEGNWMHLPSLQDLYTSRDPEASRKDRKTNYLRSTRNKTSCHKNGFFLTAAGLIIKAREPPLTLTLILLLCTKIPRQMCENLLLVSQWMDSVCFRLWGLLSLVTDIMQVSLIESAGFLTYVESCLSALMVRLHWGFLVGYCEHWKTKLTWNF